VRIRFDRGFERELVDLCFYCEQVLTSGGQGEFVKEAWLPLVKPLFPQDKEIRAL
jgi:hypothetical protein